MIENFKIDLESETISFVVSKWITDRTPHLFYDQHFEYLKWKEKLAQGIGIDGRSIAIIGSACVGFSLNPNKNLEEFNTESDIDVAIISSHYFNVSWHFLRSLGASLYGLSQRQQNVVRDHVNRLIYWGTIAADKILEILPFGSEWMEALNKVAEHKLTFGRDINIRIYKDFESLKAYQILSVKNAQDNLLGKPTIEVLG